MDRSNLDGYMRENMGLIRSLAAKGMRRLHAVGASIDMDDLEQELSIIFVKVYDSFDEDRGAKFSTVFTVSANRHINRIVAGFAFERIEMRVASMEEISSASGDDDWNVEETIPGNSYSPEELMDVRSTIKNVCGSLSPLAMQVVEMIVNPPDFLELEIEAACAHAEYARSVGTEKRSRAMLNPAYVCNVLEKITDLPHADFSAVRRELAALEKRIYG